jgi:Type IV secretory pathway, VirD4 components
MTTAQHLYPPFIVGKYKGEYLKYYGQDFLMTAAGTRSGKGTSLVIPNLLTYADSVVVEDIKEENYHYTSGYRRACGQETYLWAPFSEDGRSHAYNPLEYIAGRPAYARVGDVMTIGEHLYPSNVDARLKYWNDNARNLFIGLVLYLLETPSLPCTFGEVLRQASGKGRAIREHISSIVSTRADAAHATEGLPPLTFECLDALNRFLSQSKEAFANIVSTMTAPLNVFSNPVVDAATSRSDFDLADVRKKRMSIYVGIKPGDLKAGALLVNLFFFAADRPEHARAACRESCTQIPVRTDPGRVCSARQDRHHRYGQPVHRGLQPQTDADLPGHVPDRGSEAVRQARRRNAGDQLQDAQPVCAAYGQGIGRVLEDAGDLHVHGALA